MGDILHWLEEQKEYPKFFFRDRDTGKNLAAAGVGGSGDLQVGAYTFSGVPSMFSPQHVRDDYGDIRPADLQIPYLSRKDTPTKAEWIQLVEQTLCNIEQRNFDKVVLARKTTLELQKSVSPYELLRYLCNRAKRATCFLLETSPGIAFLGATPEKLFSRRGNQIIVEAVAGTCPIGGILGEKERREFLFVKEFIEEKLKPLSSHFSWENDRIIETTKVQHFFSRCLANLKESIPDKDLITLLHPTPAMAGLPQKEALEHLKNHEPFERGWYAAPLGWMRPEEASFAVGIRCAEITPQEVHLFAGAGIVEGSEPEKEWDELELKISQYMRQS
ncbi:MAG: isochorismate synthase [Verrucomicrobia bacterium]|nr:isochorismate synthase [Verrucomicrobiota bacterium]